MLSLGSAEKKPPLGPIADKPVWVIMGVSGAGKSSIASALASEKDYYFLEGDSLHPSENIAAMTAGKALTDEMRAPWLADIASAVQRQRKMATSGVVVSCSALKLSYRDFFRSQIPNVRFAYLEVSRPILADRLKSREGHFMTDQLLDSQLATLELFDHESDLVVVDANESESVVISSLLSIVA